MYKNLEPSILGLICSQSELIELALTHKFLGLSVDFDALHEQVQQRGLDHAIRFLMSAPIKTTSARLPINWTGDAETFQADLANLESLIEPLRAIECQSLVTSVASGSEHLPYHQNFEQHRQRLAEMADKLKSLGMTLGITFEIPFGRDDDAIPFIREPQGLVTLLKTTNSSNLGIVVDTWSWTVTRSSFDLLEGLTAEQVLDVRLADVPEGFQLDRLTPKDRLIYGSTGVVAGQQLLELLQQMDYLGPVTPFVDSSQFSGMGRDDTVRQAAAMVTCFLSGPKPEDSPTDAEGVTAV